MHHLETLIYSRGDTIFKQGDTGDCGYIIMAGEVEVYRQNQWGKETLVSRLGVHELIGELCLFEDAAVRIATVRAFTDTVEVLKLEKPSVGQECAALSPTMKLVLNALLHRLRQSYSKIALLS
jgi:CRP-like cAMP-binding protein